MLSILAKGHLLDPNVVIPYRSLSLLVAMLKKQPTLRERISRIAEKHASAGPYGPIGIAIKFLGDIGLAISAHESLQITDAEGKSAGWFEMSPGELRHDLRDRLLKLRWSSAESDRPSLTGIASGVDYQRTNELWKRPQTAPKVAQALRTVIAGAVYTKAHFIEGATCRLCNDQKVDSAFHMWWECSAFDEVRKRPAYKEIKLDPLWPRCLTEHSILPRGVRDVPSEAIQKMMAEILQKRRVLETDESARHIHPWRKIDEKLCKSFPKNFTRLNRDTTVALVGGRRMFQALKSWLTGMKWSHGGSVTNAELAIDFEVFTGLDLPGFSTRPGPVPLNDRAARMYRLLKTLDNACKACNLGCLLPGKRCRVGSLNSVGGNLMMGFKRRPVFRGGQETMGVLENQLVLSRHGLSGDCWGADVFPSYPPERLDMASVVIAGELTFFRFTHPRDYQW